MTNSKLNSLYREGKIYKVTLNSGKIYVGSTCEDLNTRLNWHTTNKKSAIFKHKNEEPKIELITDAPSKGKKSLERVENGYIEEYAEKYGDLLINIKCNPNKKPERIEYKVEIENEDQLRLRAGLEKLIKIKDDTTNKLLYFDTKIKRKRIHGKSRYSK